MFCSKCGQIIADNSAFCVHCGAKNNADIQQPMQPTQYQQPVQFQQPQYYQPVYNQPVPKKRRVGLITGIIIALALIIVGIVALIVILLNNDKDVETKLVVSNYEEALEIFIESINEDDYDLYKDICLKNMHSKELYNSVLEFADDNMESGVFKPEVIGICDSSKMDEPEVMAEISESTLESLKADLNIDATELIVFMMKYNDSDTYFNIFVVETEDGWRIAQFLR